MKFDRAARAQLTGRVAAKNESRNLDRRRPTQRLSFSLNYTVAAAAAA
jgi:hypothetical protein